MSTETAVAKSGRVEGRSPSRMAWERIKKDRTAKVSAAIIGFFILLAFYIDCLWIRISIHHGMPSKNQASSPDFSCHHFLLLLS